MPLAILATTAAPHVVATFHDADARRLRIVGELIKMPTGGDSAAYAQALVEAEGLTSWNPSEPTTASQPGAELPYRSRTAGNGRTVLVYFNLAPSGPARVCRIRGASLGMSDARYRALRWCVGSLGVTLPATAPALVAGASNDK